MAIPFAPLTAPYQVPNYRVPEPYVAPPQDWSFLSNIAGNALGAFKEGRAIKNEREAGNILSQLPVVFGDNGNQQPVSLSQIAAGGMPSTAGRSIPPPKEQGNAWYQEAIRQGLPPLQAAVFTGNVQQESGFNPRALNQGEGAFGGLQWRQARRTGLEAFARQRGTTPADIPTQIAWARQEGSGPERAAWSAFMAARTPEEANAALKRFIRYGDNSEGTRLQNARAYLGQPAASPAAEAATAVAQGREPAQAPDGIAVVGDSIAVGLGQQMRGARVNAEVGIPSAQIVGRVPQDAQTVVVSLGANDDSSAVGRTVQSAVAARRRNPNARFVWVVPANNPQAANAISAFARSNGDPVVTFQPGRDGIHPASYRQLAAQVQRAAASQPQSQAGAGPRRVQSESFPTPAGDYPSENLTPSGRLPILLGSGVRNTLYSSLDTPEAYSPSGPMTAPGPDTSGGAPFPRPDPRGSWLASIAAGNPPAELGATLPDGSINAGTIDAPSGVPIEGSTPLSPSAPGQTLSPSVPGQSLAPSAPSQTVTETPQAADQGAAAPDTAQPAPAAPQGPVAPVTPILPQSRVRQYTPQQVALLQKMLRNPITREFGIAMLKNRLVPENYQFQVLNGQIFAINPQTGEALAVAGTGGPQWQNATQNGIAGQINHITGEFKPYSSSSQERWRALTPEERRQNHIPENDPRPWQINEATGEIKAIGGSNGVKMRFNPETGEFEASVGGTDLTPTTTSNEQKAQISSEEALARLNSIKQGFKPEYLTLGGQLANLTRSWRAWLGGQQALGPDDQSALTDYATWRSRTLTNLSQYLHDMSGAAITPQEYERLKASLPNPDDDPVTFKAKLDDVITQTEAAIKRHADRLGGQQPDLSAPQSQQPQEGGWTEVPGLGRFREIPPGGQ